MKKTFACLAHRRLIFGYLLFLFFTLPSFAADESSSNEFEKTKSNKKQVIVTEYFDIIFTEDSKQSALILADSVDALYLKACALLKSEPYFRLPLVLVSGIDVLNGYFSYIPYNHIVLYDTIPEEGSLAVFSESLLSVFYHEVVHAVSIQKKSKTLRNFSKIFGDVFTPAPFLYTPLFMIEGVTVSLESRDGEGRLNDSFATQIIRQAKIEEKFPTWQQASQARDIYPVGSTPYLFGGAFSDYLQNTYGMDSYGEFWGELGKFHFFGSLESIVAKVYGKKQSQRYQSRTQSYLESIVAKVYGKKLKDLWNEFENSVPLPESDSIIDPKKSNEIKSLQTKKALYQFLTQSQKGFAWFDASSNEIWYESFETGNRKKLFTTSDGQQALSLSLDGNYLVSSFVEAYPYGNNKTVVYNLAKKKKLQTFNSLRDASLVQLADGKDYLAGVKTEGQLASIEVWSFLEKKDKPAHLKNFPLNSIPFSLQALDDGRLAYILKAKESWSLVFWNPLDGSEESIQVLSGREPLKYLNPVFFDDNLIGLSFSYAEKDSLPKMGFFDFASKSIFLQSQNFSGGLHYPLMKDSAVVFVSKFFDHDSLFVSPFETIFKDARFIKADTMADDADARLAEVLAEGLEIESMEAIASIESVDDEARPETISLDAYKTKKYNPIAYMTKGIFLPTVSLDVTEDTSGNEEIDFSLGFMYVTGDPADTWQILIQPSYDFTNEKIYLQTEIATTAFPLPLSLEGLSVFGLDGSVENDYKLSSTIEIPLGNSPYGLNFATSLFLSHGRKNAESAFFNFLHNGNIFSFSSIRNTNLNPFALKGFELGTSLCFFDPEYPKLSLDTNYAYNFFASYCLPQVLPIQNPIGFTYNLPTVFEASLFTSQNVYEEEEALWSASAKTILFAFDFQNALSNIYIQRFVFEAEYACEQGLDFIDYKNPLDNFSHIERDLFKDSVAISAYFTSSVIFGMLVTQLKIDLGATFRYHIREKKPEWSLLVGFNM